MLFDDGLVKIQSEVTILLLFCTPFALRILSNDIVQVFAIQFNNHLFIFWFTPCTLRNELYWWSFSFELINSHGPMFAKRMCGIVWMKWVCVNSNIQSNLNQITHIMLLFAYSLSISENKNRFVKPIETNQIQFSSVK